MDNTQLPAEVGLTITKAAIEYSNSLPFFSNEIREAWESGATEYATKLHQEQQDKDRLKEELDTAILANENLISRMEGWQKQLHEVQKDRDAARTLLSKVILRHEMDELPDRLLYNEIKSFLDGK